MHEGSGKRASHGVHAKLSVLAALEHEARGFSLRPRQPVRSVLTGRHASRLRGRGLNFEEIRRYLPGDDVRNIDWKVTARTRKPHVRVYTEESDRPALLVVDQRVGMFFGSRRVMKSVAAAETAALAAWRVVTAGDRVGGVLFNDDQRVELRPQRSRARVLQLLGSMVEMNHSLGAEAGITRRAEALNETLRHVASTAHHDHLICVISDFAGGDDETRRLIAELSQHNDVVLALVYDPLEAELPDVGRVVVSSGELQLEVDTARQPLRRSFQREFTKRLERVRELAHVHEIPVLPIQTSQPIAPQLRALLGAPAPTRRPAP